MKDKKLISDVVALLELEHDRFSQSCKNTDSDVIKQGLQKMFLHGIDHCIETVKNIKP